MEEIKNKNLYEINRIIKTYGNRTVVDVNNIYINEGDFFVLVGPSGAGKSTFLRILKYLEMPTEGEMSFNGEKTIYPLPIKIQRQVSMVFQRPEFIKGTVFDNVEYPLWLRNKKNKDLVEDILAQMHLEDLQHEKASNLSGGELQRLALARAMVVDPQVLLLDEPTANLDPYNVELIEDIIIELNRLGKTIIMVTHNVFQAKRLADTVGLMLNGKIIEITSNEKFFNLPKDQRVKDFLDGKMIY